MTKFTLSDRMKKYEEVTDFRLMPRSIAILRLDGVSFHTLTKKLHLEKPYDAKFSSWMSQAALTLAGYMQGCMLGYTQSDEMTFIIRSDQSEDSSAWFDNRIQKIVSVSSGIVSSVFNKLLHAHLTTLGKKDDEIPVASFDARLHSVPSLTEAINNLVWRGRDCTKNSISGAAYYELSKKHGRKTARKMLDGLNQERRQELLFSETGVNWNDYIPEFKRGIITFKKDTEIVTENGTAIRRKWVVEAAPIFTSEAGKAWLTEILGRSRLKENVQKEEVRQDKDAQED